MKRLFTKGTFHRAMKRVELESGDDAVLHAASQLLGAIFQHTEQGLRYCEGRYAEHERKVLVSDLLTDLSLRARSL